MAPLRREGSRGAGRSAACRHHGRGWLSSRRRRCRRTSGGLRRVYDTTGGTGASAALTDDVLAAIFTRLPNAADVVRCAATCRRWASVVAKEAGALSRALLPPLPGLALGFFHHHQDNRQDAGAVTTTNTRKRKRRSTGTTVECSTPAPCFAPTASGSRLLIGFHNLPSGSGVDLSRSRPIASRNGRLVLELESVDDDDGSLRLYVCNPMTGDVAVLPPLVGKDRPKVYACTLLTDSDLLDRPSSSGGGGDLFFRVLIVYNRDRFTALRSYSSDTCSWSTEARKTSGPKLTNWDLGKLGQGIVLHGGVAYWPLKRTALAVRFDTSVAPPAQVRMPPDGVPNPLQQLRLLSVAPDGKKLCFLDAGYCAGCASVSWTVFDTSTGQWVREGFVRLTRLKIKCAVDINLRWFCEKSGILLFTLGKGSSNPGTFAMSLATKKVDKLDDCSSWTNFVGYEMDGVTRLRSIAQ